MSLDGINFKAEIHYLSQFLGQLTTDQQQNNDADQKLIEETDEGAGP